MGKEKSFSFDINKAWFEFRGTTSGLLKMGSGETLRGPDLDWKLHGDMPRKSSEASDVARDPMLIGLERRPILAPRQRIWAVTHDSQQTLLPRQFGGNYILG